MFCVCFIFVLPFLLPVLMQCLRLMSIIKDLHTYLSLRATTNIRCCCDVSVILTPWYEYLYWRPVLWHYWWDDRKGIPPAKTSSNVPKISPGDQTTSYCYCCCYYYCLSGPRHSKYRKQGQKKKLTSGYATWFTAGSAIRIGHYDVIDDVITQKL